MDLRIPVATHAVGAYVDKQMTTEMTKRSWKKLRSGYRLNAITSEPGLTAAAVAGVFAQSSRATHHVTC